MNLIIQFGEEMESLLSTKETQLSCIQLLRKSIMTHHHKDLKKMMDVITDRSPIFDLIQSIELYDQSTCTHSWNVALYAIALLKTYNPKASENEVIAVGLGGLLHDLGKINISTSIINSKDKLEDKQMEIIQRHPGDGRNIIHQYQENASCNSSFVNLKLIKRVVYEHHEHYDGSGYPQRIAGDRIHLLSRIVAIADFFDALTSKRSYQETLEPKQALALMQTRKGEKIDPDLFDQFQNYLLKSSHVA